MDLELPLPWPQDPPRAQDVVLRRFAPRDVPMLRDLATDPYVAATTTLPRDATQLDALRFVQRQLTRPATGRGWSFCVARAADDEAVGQIGLWTAGLGQGRCTAGYAIAPSARRQGYAGKALRALTAFAWTIAPVHRVELYVEPDNAASLRTATAAGFAREGLLRSHQEIDGRRADMVLLAAIRPDRSR
ncbi:GNAT family N-acetyltransferase [Arsenicicoccus dermatophilus]|uniref:GNAT family N-acetyltransferase n=1 Tax=Arsenicicoccus dermatophilus TaxID=1076331 RepID=UPI0039174B84